MKTSVPTAGSMFSPDFSPWGVVSGWAFYATVRSRIKGSSRDGRIKYTGLRHELQRVILVAILATDREFIHLMTTPEKIESVLASLPQRVEGEPRIAIFDCDGTLIKGDVGEAMFRFQVSHFLFRESPAEIWNDFPLRNDLKLLYSSLVRHPPDLRAHDRRFRTFSDMLISWYFDHLAQGKTEKACGDIVRLLAGFSADELREIAADTLRLELSSPLGGGNMGDPLSPTGIRYIKETCNLLNRLRDLRFEIWVISGSNRWSVEEVCTPLGISASNIIGIDLKRKNHVYSSSLVSPVPVLDGKVRAWESLGLSRPTIVVSDSVFDFPLFGISTGAKVLVMSDDRSREFFAETGMKQDDSWLVLDNLTFES